jgi:DNA (cytosine-5)-methyltransferase 1
MQTQVQQHTSHIYVPDTITKELKIITTPEGKRKIRLSSNFLPLLGFEHGTRHSVDPIGNMTGLRLEFAENGRQKVYQRRYNSRRNNPLETVVEIGSQALLNSSIPSYTERLHFTMTHGRITVRPLPNHTFSIRRRLRDEINPFMAMVGLTSGVDMRCLIDCGFTIDSVLERRPEEMRDTRDMTETGALNAIANAPIRLLINEDISTVDWNRVKDLMADAPQIAVLHISLPCDDHSAAKSNSLKERSIENLSTSRDIVYDALRMIETIRPACVMIEQVRNFASSAEGQLLTIKLRKWGYDVTDGIFRADQYGGLTRRERYYCVASIFPGFTMPAPDTEPSQPLWDKIQHLLPACRDISNTKSLAKGILTGRGRFITPQSLVSPTILKSQSRQAADSIWIAMPDGTYRFPTLDMLQLLQGIPADFDLSTVSSEIATEIIGQSIDVPLHEKIARAVHQHIADNVGHHTIINIVDQNAPPPPTSTVGACAEQTTLQF